MRGFKVSVSGEHNGQAIVIHPSDHEFLIVGFRSGISLSDPAFQWPAMKNIQVQRVRWVGAGWENDGEPSYGVDQSNQTLSVDLDTPQAVLVGW